MISYARILLSLFLSLLIGSTGFTQEYIVIDQHGEISANTNADKIPGGRDAGPDYSGGAFGGGGGHGPGRIWKQYQPTEISAPSLPTSHNSSLMPQGSTALPSGTTSPLAPSKQSMTSIPTPPPVPPFDFQALSQTTPLFDNSVNDRVTQAIANALMIAELTRQSLAGLDKTAEKDIRQLFSKDLLINKAGFERNVNVLKQIEATASEGKLAAEFIVPAVLNPLTTEQIRQVVDKRINEQVVPKLNQAKPVLDVLGKGNAEHAMRVLGYDKNAKFEGYRNIGLEEARKNDEAAYKQQQSQEKPLADKALKTLGGISSKVDSTWEKSPANVQKADTVGKDVAPESYTFEAPKSVLRQELISIHSELADAKASQPFQVQARQIGLSATVAGDKALVVGDQDGAAFYRDVAVSMLDLTLSLAPGVGFAKDVFEAVTGNSLLNGKPLTSFERGAAVFGVLTVGVASQFGAITKAANALVKVAHASKQAEISSHVIRVAMKAAELGNRSIEEFTDFVKFNQRLLKSEVGSIGDIDKVVTDAAGPIRRINFDPDKIKRKFDAHAAQFGIIGTRNKATLDELQKLIVAHVENPKVKVIPGTFRRTIEVIHYLNPETGMNIMKYPNGVFLSAWILEPSKAQYRNVLERGML